MSSTAASLLVRPPARTLAEGLVSHIADQRESIRYELALEQWQAYIDIFRRHGWRVLSADQDDTLPDSVFVEDGVVSVGDLLGGGGVGEHALLILTSPGNPAREAEPIGLKKAIEEQLGLHAVRSIHRPGTLDGGDVLKVPATRTIYVGQSARTNDEGRRQFRELVEPLGWRVIGVPVIKALHLKSMLTALPDGTIIGYAPLIEDTGVFDKFVSMPEAEGAAVVHLDRPDSSTEQVLVMSSSAPESAMKLRGMGYTVITTDVSEFEVRRRTGLTSGQRF